MILDGCVRCGLPITEKSPEGGICQACYAVEDEAKFSLMMRESVSEIPEAVTKYCPICGTVFEKQPDGWNTIYCETCRDDKNLVRERNRQSARACIQRGRDKRKQPTQAYSPWYVDYDPIPVEEGGFTPGASITRVSSELRIDLERISFAPGTILRNRETGKSETIK